MNIAQWLYTSALAEPKAPALFKGKQLVADYDQFARQACALGQYLVRHYGVQSGDRVALYMPNRIEYLVLLYACWWVGAVVVPINHMLHPQEAAWIANNSTPKLIITDGGQVFEAEQLPNACSELSLENQLLGFLQKEHAPASKPMPLVGDKLAWLFYTSGTTGRPKGVMLSHQNLLAMSLCYFADVDHVHAKQAKLYAAPMSHGAGLYNFMFVRAGARHVVPDSRGFNSQEILQLASQLKNLSFFAAPTMCKRLVTTAKELKVKGEGIHLIVLGGGPMYEADLIEALDVFGPRFAQIYGQGETPMTITAASAQVIGQRAHPQWRQRLASVGKPHSCIELRIVDDQLENLPMGTSGEILVRGLSVMHGYWNDPQASKATLVDGWLLTGDIGFLDEYGFLTLTDRAKDVIISGGSNIYPREVEEVLIQHPKVFEAAVVGTPSDEWGEEVVAFVVPQPKESVDEADLENWCVQHIASYKKPKRYIFVADLPKNSYGKILKTNLREQLLQNSVR